MTACSLCHRDTPEHEHLCLVHAGELRGWLAEIPGQALLLEEFVTPAGGRATQGRPGGGRAHSPAPVDLRVLTLLGPGRYDPSGPDDDGQAPLLALLGAWAGHIAYQYPAATRDAYGVQRSQPCEQAWPAGGETITGWCAWLTAYLPYALTLPLAADLYRALGQLVSRLRQLTHAEPRRRPMAGPCPQCEACALVRTDGQDTVTCLLCGHQLGLNAYDTHQAAVLAAHKATARPARAFELDKIAT
ncbi:hypothetical protein AB0D38_02950 [Streptomyces sp. NPDC048279]|uniref:hypothetical protein n=1 Tax=Streptomyces sp. NPDC048279 TaxID=3154714 RepID=UPI003439D00F